MILSRLGGAHGRHLMVTARDIFAESVDDTKPMTNEKMPVLGDSHVGNLSGTVLINLNQLLDRSWRSVFLVDITFNFLSQTSRSVNYSSRLVHFENKKTLAHKSIR